jgi:hypothetical protein
MATTGRMGWECHNQTIINSDINKDACNGRVLRYITHKHILRNSCIKLLTANKNAAESDMYVLH